VSISEFVRLPAASGLRRVKARAIAAGAARAAPASPAVRRSPVPVLRLACTLTAGRAGGLAEAVLARLAGSGQRAGTVVLELDGAGLDDDARAALCALRALLLRGGTDLRLVVTSREARNGLAAAADHRIGPEGVHDCARAAMLAAFAKVPGPGLVDAAVRAALAAPADTL